MMHEAGPEERPSSGSRLAQRLTRTFVLVAGVLLLGMGLVLIAVSYQAQLEQVRVRQQKTAREAALMSTAYLSHARDTLNNYGQLGSWQALLLRSMSIQVEELDRILVQYEDMFQGLTLVDAYGNEMARVSRFHTFDSSELTSRAGEPSFEAAIQGQVYLADDTHLPPYSSLPAVTIAVPMKGRDRDGVLIADVSMAGMWDAISQVEVGETGYAYLIRGTTGELISHSDFDRYLALEGSTITGVALVRQIMAGADEPEAQYMGLEGEQVVGAAADLPGTGWTLVAELPTREALAGVRQMLYLLGLLTVVGAVAAGSLGLFIPRRVVRPILALQEGAREIGAGELEQVIEVKTGDELEDLADSFNQMAANLRRSHQELARWGQELEARVAERTTELAQATDRLRRRAGQLQISAEVAHAIASVRGLDELLPQVTRLISERFGWYHVGIFLLDEAPAGSQSAVLHAANSEGGQRMLARGHRLRVGKVGIVGTVTASGEPRIALDVGQDAVFFDNPDLPDTRSEMALPLKVGAEIIGALDVQSDEPAAYDDEDVALLSTLADQVAVAIQNARLFEQTQEALSEVQELHRRYVRQEWARTLAMRGELAYEYRREGVSPDTLPGEDEWPAELRQALAAGRVVALASDDATDEEGEDLLETEEELLMGGHLPAGQSSPSGDGRRTGGSLRAGDGRGPENGRPPDKDHLRAALAAPIKLRDQIIGAVDLEEVGESRRWTADEVALVQAVADQVGLALENARLFADTQRRAEQLATLHRVGLDITAALDLDGVLQALYEQIRRMVDVGSFYVALYDETTGMVEFPIVTGIDGRFQVSPVNLREQTGAESLAGWVIKSGETLHLPDLLSLPDDSVHQPIPVSGRATRSYVGVPLLFRERVFGVMSVQSYEPGAYSQEDIDLLTTIATQTSIAIQNARAYERLRETAEELREVDRLKTQFLANMSHELRTPLNSIIGFSRVMLKGIDGPLTDLQEADLASIYNSGQHLLSLINSILDMSKIEAGKMDLSFERVQLGAIFEAALSTTRALVKDRPIELFSSVPDNLPAVWADAQRVRQILINLFSNAAKFTQEGKIILLARAGAEYVTITVADTGIGIEPDAQRRLFIPFQQVDASTKRRAGGTGLGLAISRSFVEMHGGRIWVVSKPGKGSAFSFTLPIYEVVAAKVLGQGPDSVSVLGGDVPEALGRLRQAELDPDKKIVLAIDDDQGVLTLLKRYLENDGYQVVGVLESREALSIARRLAAQERPRLAAITLDVLMPVMDGWEVLAALKRDPQTKDVPVILCSIVEDLEKGLSMGAAAGVCKPLTRNDLLEALEKVERQAQLTS
jgi:signal transduction histidine kinase/CheY-like chemotaxis protein